MEDRRFPLFIAHKDKVKTVSFDAQRRKVGSWARPSEKGNPRDLVSCRRSKMVRGKKLEKTKEALKEWKRVKEVSMSSVRMGDA